MNRFVLVSCMFFSSYAVFADDSLSALMQRMKSNKPVKISYQETRTMELFDQAWQGNGFMYSTPAGLMLQEQQQPHRLLMAVNKNDLFYYDPDNNIRHQGKIQEDDPLTLQFAVFKALINADEALLNRLYQIDFVTKPKRWVMTLRSKEDVSDFSIVVSGPLLQKVDTIIVTQADGDLSEFMLKNEENVSAEQVLRSVNYLYAELTGE